MTDTNLQTAETLLRDLLVAIGCRPEAIEIANQLKPSGACYWVFRVHAEDEGKVLGQQGSHVKALTALMMAWGRADKTNYSLRFIDRAPPGTRERPQPEEPLTYDIAPAATLLERCLSNLDLTAFCVEAGPGNDTERMLTFTLKLKLMFASDYSALVRPGNPDGETTLIGALGTLFRAIGRKDGVKIEIALAEPK
jgi:predicted RNA-binding protein YlqC (UPF0109 family)